MLARLRSGSAGLLRIPEHPKLWAQLTQIERELESDRVIRVYKRGRQDTAPSPDLADALALAVEARYRGSRPPGGIFL